VSGTAATVPELLAALAYEFVPDAERESCMWLSVLVGAYVAQCRGTPAFRALCWQLVDRAVNTSRRPSFLAPVTIRHIDLGARFPVLDQIGVQAAAASAAAPRVVRVTVTRHLHTHTHIHTQTPTARVRDMMLPVCDV
jgi:hypothetical protein